MNFLKFALHFVKGPLENDVINPLVANRVANIAEIEAIVGAGSASAESAVEAFVVGEARKFPSVAWAVPFVQPRLHDFVVGLVGSGEATVPAFYDKAVAFLQKEDSYI